MGRHGAAKIARKQNRAETGGPGDQVNDRTGQLGDAEAEKTYQIGMQYKQAKKVASAEYYLGKVPQRWPDSPWAVKAKGELAQLAKMPRKPSKPSRIIIPPGSTDPFMSSGPGGGMMGGMGMNGMGMGMGGMGMGGMGMPGGMM